MINQTISPFLWFDKQAEDAAKFYVSIFPNSAIRTIVHCTAAGPGPEGSVMTLAFHLNGQNFTALNGGPAFKFTEAVSFQPHCTCWPPSDSCSQYLSTSCCVSQFTTATVERVMKAMMEMRKLDIAGLENAFHQE
jgi:predicted 3-demethylubiquinone-9 3-methyltransferase (glyoxalase superfamily)